MLFTHQRIDCKSQVDSLITSKAEEQICSRVKRIRFDRYIVAVGVNLFPLKKVVIVPSWEGSIIGRWGSEWQDISSHLALLGGSLGIRYEITDNINIEFLNAVLDRVDLNTKHGGSNIIISNSITLIYKL